MGLLPHYNGYTLNDKEFKMLPNDYYMLSKVFFGLAAILFVYMVAYNPNKKYNQRVVK